MSEIWSSGWVRVARYTLIGVGICYLLVGVVASAGMFMKFQATKAPPALGLAVAAMIFVVSVAIGVANFVAASGLGSGKRWAWILTVVFGALYAPSICLPFGAVLLVAMLRAEVREAYMSAPKVG